MEFGCGKDYFSLTEIGKLDKSCCPNSKIQVIDFDKTKESYCSVHDLKNLKSCDALKMVDEPERIDFIEMKGFKQFINRQLSHDLPLEEQIASKISDFDLIGKIRDSIFILNSIVSSKAFEISGSQQKSFHPIEKNFIVLTDIDIQHDPIDHIVVSLTFLSQTSSLIEQEISKLLVDQITQLDVASFYNIQRPMLLSCKDLDGFYGNDGAPSA